MGLGRVVGRGGVKYDAVTFHLLRLVDPSSSDGTIHLCILTGVKKRKRKVLRVKNRLMKLHTKSPNLHNTNGKRSTPVDLDGINIIKEDDARDGHTDAESRASLSLVRTIRAQLRMEHLPPPPQKSPSSPSFNPFPSRHHRRRVASATSS